MIGGFGGCSVDKISYISHWPDQEQTAYIQDVITIPGGMTLNALVCASRLGIPVSYRGALGKDEEGEYLKNFLNGQAVQTDYCSILTDGSTPYSQIMTSPDGKRTIFHKRGIRDCDYRAEFRPVLEGLKVLLLDGSWMKNAIKWAEEAHRRKIPIVLDLSPNNTHPLRDKLIELADYPVFSTMLAQKISSRESPRDQISELQQRFGGIIIITMGEKGLWYSSGKRVHYKEAFSINPVDTTGAGDSFHGAMAAGVSMGLSLDKSIELAMATAALKCCGKGHEALPDYKQVRSFLNKQLLS